MRPPKSDAPRRSRLSRPAPGEAPRVAPKGEPRAGEVAPPSVAAPKRVTPTPPAASGEAFEVGAAPARATGRPAPHVPTTPGTYQTSYSGPEQPRPGAHPVSPLGLRMAGSDPALEQVVARRELQVMEQLSRGETPAGFHGEQVPLEGGTCELLVAPELMARLRQRGTGAADFFIASLRLRGPGEAPIAMQALVDQRVVLDAVPSAPAPAGGTHAGYCYVNLSAPPELDLLAVSHQWVRTSHSPELLLRQDRTLLQRLTLEAETRAALEPGSALLAEGPLAPELFVGNPAVLRDALGEHLDRMGWQPDETDGFLDGLSRFLMRIPRLRADQELGLASVVGAILLDAGRRGNLQDAQAFRSIARNLQTWMRLTSSDSPSLLRADQARALIGRILVVDHGRLSAPFLASKVAELQNRPPPEGLEGLLPPDFAHAALVHSPASFYDLLLHPGEGHHYLQCLAPEHLQLVATRVLQQLDTGARPIDAGAVLRYLDAVQALENRVGVLTNAKVFRALYEYNFSKELEHIADDVELDELDREPLEGEPSQLEMDLAGLREGSTNLFNQNPGPQMLTELVDFYRQGPREAPLRLTPAESNNLIWLTRSIPKKEGFTRDRRRQIHRYVLTMWEESFRHKEDPTLRNFMGSMVASIDIPRMGKEGVSSAVDFMLRFTNLAPAVRLTAARQLGSKLEAMRRELPQQPKAFLTPDHFRAMSSQLDTILVDHLVNGAETLSHLEKTRLRQEVTNHPAAWTRRGLLSLLAGYHSFQNTEGKIATETYLRQLMTAKVQGDRFTNLPRGAWSAAEKKWLTPALVKAWRGGYRVEVKLDNGVGSGPRFTGVAQDILAHLGIRAPADSRALPEAFRVWLDAPGNQDVPRAEREALASTAREVVQHLLAGGKTDEQQLAAWRQQLLPLGRAPSWFTSHPGWREVLVNLEQIARIQSFDWSQVKRVHFELSDDPADFALSASEPYQTCQRLNEPTGQNEDGRPINRLRQKQFLLARLVAETGEGGTTVLSRAHLEVAEGIPPGNLAAYLASAKPPEDIQTRLFLMLMKDDDASEDDEPPVRPERVLLVERQYQQGILPPGVLDRELLKWATPLFDRALFAGQAAAQSEDLFIHFLPSDGPIYRDTFAEGFWKAIDLRAPPVEEGRSVTRGATVANRF